MLHTLFPHVREISRGKTNNLHSMYPHHLHPNVRVVLGLRFVLQAHPHRVCLMMFVFLGSELCRQLPSDSPSRRTPLLLANGWQLQTPITDFHRQVIRHARHTIKKRLVQLDSLFFWLVAYFFILSMFFSIKLILVFTLSPDLKPSSGVFIQ